MYASMPQVDPGAGQPYGSGPALHHRIAPAQAYGPAGGMDWPGGPTAVPPVDAHDFSNEPPLLEELGVDFSHIRTKVLAVLMLNRPIEEGVMADSDMAGPLVFALILGFCLLLTGKVHFGYIYGFGAMGGVGMYLVVNLLSHARANLQLDLSRTFSVLGYGLLPITLLSALAVFVDLRGVVGSVLGLGAVVWSTLASARFFEAALHMQQQKWLVAYPAALLYGCFVLITIF